MQSGGEWSWTGQRGWPGEGRQGHRRPSPGGPAAARQEEGLPTRAGPLTRHAEAGAAAGPRRGWGANPGGPPGGGCPRLRARRRAPAGTGPGTAGAVATVRAASLAVPQRRGWPGTRRGGGGGAAGALGLRCAGRCRRAAAAARRCRGAWGQGRQCHGSECSLLRRLLRTSAAWRLCCRRLVPPGRRCATGCRLIRARCSSGASFTPQPRWL
mmetsp:Transcript_11809/g.46090  ORF Transcript_11809/g.46090 Transcript_11809/m.46090 type:complete len:212 (-) Transcript_11809:261-896(-)